MIRAFDLETELITPGKLAPPMVCMTWQDVGKAAQIVHRFDAEPLLRAWLEDPDVILLGHNVAYDFAVVCSEFPALTPLVFKAYEDDRVTDSMTRQKLLDIAAGCYRGKFDRDGTTWIKHGYSLFDLARRCMGITLKKDGWRLAYGEVRDIPLSGWIEHAKFRQVDARKRLASGDFGPYEQKDLEAIITDDPKQILEYPLDDARLTLQCYLKQEPCASEYLKSQFHEARAAFVLHLSSCWGMRTDAQGVEDLRVLTETAIADVKERLVTAGLVRKDGSRDTKKAAAYMLEVCARDNIKVRQTKGGGTSLDEESCTATEDPLLVDYAKFTQLNKALTADVPMLMQGTVTPIQPRYDIAETARTTCSGPNLQNVSKR